MDRRNKRERKRAATSVLYCSSSLFSLWMVFFDEQCCFLLFILINFFFNFIILCDCYISCVGVFFFFTFSWQFKLGVIIFGSVRFLSKKYNQAGFFLKKTKTESVQTDQLRSGSVILEKNRFKPVWFGFFRVGSIFFRVGSVFLFGLGLVQFGLVFSVLGL